MTKNKLMQYLIGGVWLAMATPLLANDWPAWRGPEQTGQSRENAVVTSWSEGGENLLWKADIGGRSTPIVMNGRVYLDGPVGSGSCVQERTACVDAESGALIWEHRFNVFHTDIVFDRVGWSAPAGDPETGNVYVHGTGGELFAFDRDGKIIWKWSLSEELGRSSGYGGRLQTPIIDEGRVIISFTYILTQWDTGKTKAGHRYYAFDKHTGEIQWMAQPGGRPKNTTYSAPVVTVADGKRIIIAPNADGNVYGLLARTGEKLWTYRFSKAGLNATGVADGKYFYLGHSEENISGTVMGAVACIDVTGSGDVTDTHEVWRVEGIEAGYSSLAIANGRVYVAENKATLHALDAKTGEEKWRYDLGRAMKGSPLVTADGVIYVGEVNGLFHILKDEGDKCVSLDTKQFTRPDDHVVEIQGSPAMADGRVFFMTRYHTFALGKKGTPKVTVAVPQLGGQAARSTAPAARMLVIPAEASVKPGGTQAFRVKLFDEAGQSVGVAPAKWSVKKIAGEISGDGRFHASSAHAYSSGLIEAQAGKLTATARVRISPSLPIDENFDGMPVGKQPPGWIGVDARTKLIEKDGTVVLHKKATSPSAKFARMRAFSGSPIAGGYTVGVDMMAEPKKGRHPTLSDMGLINSRYTMIVLGKEKRIRIVSWSPLPRIQKEVDFDWQPNVWYRAKMRVTPDGEGAVIAAKVWPRDEAEPGAWNLEVKDPCPNYEGSPGIYAYSKGTSAKRHGSSVYFDNYKVTSND